MPGASTKSDTVPRIAAFYRETIARVADELVAIPEGWVARAPSLPLVYSINHVRLDVPVEPREALELLERHMGEMPYRHLVVGHEASGERLAAELRPAGWKIEREVHMALTGEPDRELDTSGVVDSLEDAVRLMTRWMEEDEECGAQPEMLAQVLEANRLTWRAREARHFTLRGRDGSAAGMTLLFSDGVIAEVEDVYVTPEERGRGLGRALVTHAVTEAIKADHELVFIPADDEDWPKELYAKVGFTPVARPWVFHRWMTR